MAASGLEEVGPSGLACSRGKKAATPNASGNYSAQPDERDERGGEAVVRTYFTAAPVLQTYCYIGCTALKKNGIKTGFSSIS